MKNYQLLQKLYCNKLEQLHRALDKGNALRSLVLQAEADAICQELQQTCPSH